MKITPEQMKKLGSWAEERDAILNDISVLNDEKSILERKNKEAATSLTDKETRKNEVVGEIKQLEKQQKNQINLFPKELSNLKTEKTELQGEISKEKILLASVKSEKKLVIESTNVLLKVNKGLSNKNVEVEKIVDKFNKLTTKNLSDIGKMFSILKKGLESLLIKEKEASDSANTILNKLPRWIFELQRPHSLKKPIKLNRKAK